MGRRIIGPVRQAAYDAANAARIAVEQTSNQAQKSMFQVTEKLLLFIGKLCEAADEVTDGIGVGLKIGEKEIPIEIRINLKEKEDK